VARVLRHVLTDKGAQRSGGLHAGDSRVSGAKEVAPRSDGIVPDELESHSRARRHHLAQLPEKGTLPVDSVKAPGLLARQMDEAQVGDAEASPDGGRQHLPQARHGVGLDHGKGAGQALTQRPARVLVAKVADLEQAGHDRHTGPRPEVVKGKVGLSRLAQKAAPIFHVPQLDFARRGVVRQLKLDLGKETRKGRGVGRKWSCRSSLCVILINADGPDGSRGRDASGLRTAHSPPATQPKWSKGSRDTEPEPKPTSSPLSVARGWARRSKLRHAPTPCHATRHEIRKCVMEGAGKRKWGGR